MIWVAAGGGLGAVTRYGLHSVVTRWLGEGFPWGIFCVNVFGSLIMGALGAYLLVKMPSDDALRLFAVTGFLGGFTTFSAFAFDTLKLLQNGQTFSAVIYVVASVLASIMAVFLGFSIVKALM